MNISKLSDEQKTDMFAYLCGWRKVWADNNSMVLLDANGRGVGYRLMRSGEALPNLYDVQNMALAWLVLNWASSNKSLHPEERDEMQYKMQEWLTYHVGWLDILPPADAQRLWLDKILELAIEAGLVDLRAEEREP